MIGAALSLLLMVVGIFVGKRDKVTIKAFMLGEFFALVLFWINLLAMVRG